MFIIFLLDLVDAVTLHQQLNLQIDEGDFHAQEKQSCMCCMKVTPDPSARKMHCHTITVDAGTLTRNFIQYEFMFWHKLYKCGEGINQSVTNYPRVSRPRAFDT